MPEEVSYANLKATIKTRRNLSNVVNRLNRIQRPDALDFVSGRDGAIHTKYEQREYNILKSVRERRKSQTRRALGIMPDSLGRQGIMANENLAPSHVRASDLSLKGLRRFIKQQEFLMNESLHDANVRMYENYIKAINNQYGEYPELDGMRQQLIDIVQWYIENEPEKLNAFFTSGNEILEVAWHYTDVERFDRLDLALETWRNL